MTGCFLDTTIVVNIADKIEPGHQKGQTFINANQPAKMPYYALRELLAGYVQILCDTHNVIQASENAGEALTALVNRHPAQGRKKEAMIQILAQLLKSSFENGPTGPRNEINRELLGEVARRANNVWRRARKINAVNIVQPLACFNDGKITFGPSGELRGPNNSFNCIKTQRCAAAGYLYEDKNALSKMIEALHPNKLDPSIANKNENSQRKKALKELQSNGPKAFDKRRCRALGDAYFAAMCPSGSVVITSNIKDHLPLCVALGKKAIEP